jgi:hypothetical protein
VKSAAFDVGYWMTSRRVVNALQSCNERRRWPTSFNANFVLRIRKLDMTTDGVRHIDFVDEHRII